MIPAYLEFEFWILEFSLVRPGGFEPPTSWSVAKRSVQLSYGRIFYVFKEQVLTKFVKYRYLATRLNIR